MPDEPSITDQVLAKIASHLGSSAETLQKIKFGSGAVGKISLLAIVAIIAVGAAATRLSGNYILWAIAAIVLIAICMLLGIIVIILKQPELAVLEGMELVQYKQVTLGSKNFTPIFETPPIPDPKRLANGKTIEGAESQ